MTILSSKRRRKGNHTAAAVAVATAATSSSSVESLRAVSGASSTSSAALFLSSLLHSLYQTPAAVLVAVRDGKHRCWQAASLHSSSSRMASNHSNSSSEEDERVLLCCYQLKLALHVLQKVMSTQQQQQQSSSSSSHQQQQQSSSILLYLAVTLTHVLTKNTSSWDDSLHSSIARQFLSKVSVACVVVAMQCLETHPTVTLYILQQLQVWQGGDNNNSNNKNNNSTAASNNNNNTSNKQTAEWNQYLSDMAIELHQLMEQEYLNQLESIPTAMNSMDGDWSREQAFLEQLQAMAEQLVVGDETDAADNKNDGDNVDNNMMVVADTVGSSPAAAAASATRAKRSRRGTATTETSKTESTTATVSWDSIVTAYNNLVDGRFETISLDSRVNGKRWTADTVIWLLQGPTKIMETIMDVENNYGTVEQTGFLLDVMRRWMATSGIKPPASNSILEMYYKQLVPAVETTGKKKGTVELGNPKDLSMVAAHRLLEQHAEQVALLEATTTRLVTPKVKQRTVASSASASKKPAATTAAAAAITTTTAAAAVTLELYPFMDVILQTLASLGTVGDNSVGSVDFVNRFECACAAYVIQMDIPDTRLLRFAMGKLKTVMADVSETSYTEWNRLKTTLKLDAPLKAPSLVTAKKSPSRSGGKKKSDSTEAGSGSLAGVFLEKKSGTKQDELLSIFCRAMHGRKNAATVYDALLTYLIETAEKCYGAQVSASKEKKRKGSNKTPISKRKNKKRKKNDGAAEESSDEVTGCGGSNSEDGIHMDREHALLAVEIFVALDHGLRMKDNTTHTNVRHQVRVNLTQEHIFRLIDLCLPIDVFLNRFKARGNDFGNLSGSETTVGETEKRLWDAFVNLCICLGRGQRYSDSTRRKALGNMRVAVYQKIASFRPGELYGGWPLWLPSPLRSLVAANLVGELMENTADESILAADRLVAFGFVDSIGKKLNLFSSHERPASITIPASLVEEGVDLSMSNARLFVAALARLPQAMRQSCLHLLLEKVMSFLASIKDEDFVHDEDNTSSRLNGLPGFTARLIALTMNAVVVFTCSSVTPSRVLNTTGQQLHSHLPQGQVSSFTRDHTFISLIEELQEKELCFSSLEPMHCENLQLILKQAFLLGLKCAAIDDCYLLFVTWSALEMENLWGNYPDVSSLSIVTGGYNFDAGPSYLVFELCREMLLVRLLVREARGELPRKAFVRSVLGAEAERKALQARASMEIRSMIAKASALTTAIIRLDSSGNSILSGAHVLLEIISTYTAFAIASCTQAKEDYTSFLRASYGGNEGDSEARAVSHDYYSDAESAESEDATEVAHDRLQSVCDVLHAAPAHPDWLDVDCELSHGFSYAEVSVLSTMALEVLNDLMFLAIKGSRASQMQALNQLVGIETKMADLLLDLSTLDVKTGQHEPFLESMAAICGVTECQFDPWFKAVGDDRRSTIEDNWASRLARGLCCQQNCFPTSSYTPELRAMGQWHVMMALALCSSSNMRHDKKVSVESDARVQIVSWQGVLRSALASLVPVAALLRFGINQGGRPTHPLKPTDSSILQFEALKFTATDPVTNHAPKTTIDAVSRAVSGISRCREHGSGVEAIAVNLIDTMRTFVVLKDAVRARISFSIMARIEELFERDLSVTTISSWRFITSVLVEHMQDMILSDENAWRSSLRASLCTDDEGIQTIGMGNVKMSTLISDVCGERQSTMVKGIIAMIWRDCKYCETKSRQFFVQSLCMMGGCDDLKPSLSQGELSVIGELVDSINRSSDDRIKLLVDEDIFGFHEQSASYSFDVSNAMCSLLVGALADRNYKRAPSLLTLLVEAFERQLLSGNTLSSESRNGILNLLLSYSCRCGALDSFASKCVALSKLDDRSGLENVVFLSTFLKDLKAALSSNGQITRGSKGKGCLPTLVDAGSSVPRTCTFLGGSDFMNQHWYNCYTCGLTGGKGCCTLCALVCHADHDVSYAQFSAFYCDCGSEKGGATLSESISCKCLEAVAQEKIIDLVLEAQTGISPVRVLAKPMKPPTQFQLTTSICSELAGVWFKTSAQQSLEAVISQGRNSDWIDVLLQNLRSRVTEHSAQYSTVIHGRNQDELIYSYDQVRRGVLGKITSESLAVSFGSKSPMSKIAQFRPYAFQAKISSEGPFESLKRACLSSNGAYRSAISVDERGRVAIIEPKSVVLCTLYPLLNKYSHPFPDYPHPRSSVSVVGSGLLDFDPVGVKYSKDDGKLLLIWGTHEAAFVIFDEDRCGIEKVVHLDVGVGSLETSTDFIIECVWVPGIYPCAMVRCLHSLYFFELSNDDEALSPVCSCKEGSSITFRGSVIVDACDEGSGSQRQKMFVLLDTGSLYAFELLQDSSGHLRFPSLCFGIQNAVKIVGQGKDVAVNPVGRGEWLELSYLCQSRLLVCQGTSSGVVCLHVNARCDVVQRFIMLPSKVVISAGNASNDASTTSVSAPFIHWTDIGAAQTKEGPVFRVACVGKRGTKENVVLCIEFSQRGTLVSELFCPSDVSSYSSSSTVDGIAAFSAPLMQCDDGSFDIDRRKIFTENVAVAVLLSNGSLHLFVEDGGALAVSPCWNESLLETSDVAEANAKLPPIPLLAFESFTNVSDSDDLVFAGPSLGRSDDVRMKLQRDNDLFLMSPTREGFCMSLQVKSSGTEHETRNKVIVALRILVGSTSTDCIPRKITIEGRPMECLPGTKKWYCHVLTAQEIALGVRNGLFVLSVGSTFDSSSSPVLDALEVYAVDAHKLEHWIPVGLQSLTPPGSDASKALPTVDSQSSQPQKSALLLSLEAFMRFSQLLSPLVYVLSQMEKTLLEKIVMTHALEDDNEVFDGVDTVLACFGMKGGSRAAFCDKAIIGGCLDFLVEFGRQVEGRSQDFRSFWERAQARLRKCFNISRTVATSRPINYFQSVHDMSRSPGIEASKFMPDCFERLSCSTDLVPDFVELCLVELVVASRSGIESSERSYLGNFSGLKRMLLSSNTRVTSSASRAISTFCEKYEDPSNTLENDDDLFAGRKIYYRCDGCELFPIKDIRYSLPDETRPLDLCEECFKKSFHYASRMKFSSRKFVEVDGSLVGCDTKLSCAEVKLLSSLVIDADGGDGHEKDAERHQQFENFIERLFSEVLAIVVQILDNSWKPSSERIIQLAADIARCSGDHANTLKASGRADRLAKVLIACLARVLHETRYSNREGAPPTLDILLKALIRLLVRDMHCLPYLVGSEASVQDKDSRNSNIVCEVHRAPTVQRRYEKGSLKNKAFLSCSLDSRSRCSFFAWTSTMDENNGKSLFDEVLARSLWQCLSFAPNGNELPTQHQLSDFVISLVKQLPDLDFNQSVVTWKRSMKINGTMVSMSVADTLNGVLASRCRLHDSSIYAILESPDDVLLNDSGFTDNWRKAVVEATTTLLCLVARADGVAIEKWSQFLCEVMVSSQNNLFLVQQAKRALNQLCGKNKTLYSTIRSQYTFGFHRERLISLAEAVFRSGLRLIDKGRQSGSSRRNGSLLGWSDIGCANFLGFESLMSEDVVTLSIMDGLRNALYDLTSAAKKRIDQWCQFCWGRDAQCPLITRSQGDVATYLRSLSPASLLFMLSSLISGENQILALQLLNLALAPPAEKIKDSRVNATKTMQNSSKSGPANWEESQLCLTPSEAYLFTVKFVCNGNTSELRSVASHVIYAICRRADNAFLKSFYSGLLNGALAGAGEAGKNLIELFHFLKQLTPYAAGVVDLPLAAEMVQMYWKQQMLAIKYGKVNRSYVLIETRTSSSSQKRRYELTSCMHCQHASKNRKGKDKKQSATEGPQNASNLKPVAPTKQWLPEQVVTPSRGRLEGWRQATVSDEFNSYSSFKYRLALFEIHLEINDPRGRFVKTIKIYFSPRPVSDVNRLKAEDYTAVWQECGVMNLSKGATRASCVLNKPVVAANLRIEYTDFYERLGGSKSSDGSFVVHCPRCCRVVNNAHGVCGICGEVAFQCRKCRKIHYDRMDAFLCVECGYCSSATSFVFELTAAIASNAIAVTNDADYERTRSMYTVSRRLYEDLCSTLREQLNNLLKSTASVDGPEDAGLIRAYGTRMSTETEGSDEAEFPLTLNNLGKHGSVIKAVARPDSRPIQSRACSLLRLTKEWRESASTGGSRRPPSILEQLGRDLGDEESADELMYLLETGGRSGDESMRRLLSRVQNRRERRSTANDSGANVNAGHEGTEGMTGNMAGANASTQNAPKETLDLCDRLYGLMREADCESHLLQQRILAWNRLETCGLQSSATDTDYLEQNNTFLPSHCSTCASPLAFQLLQLWLTLFEAAPDKIVVTKDMLHLLFLEDLPIQRNFIELKRQVVSSIALLSSNGGSEMVHEALRMRLQINPDMAICADILSNIVGEGGPDSFRQLSLETLQTSSSLELL